MSFIVYSYIDFACTLMTGQPWGGRRETVARGLRHAGYNVGDSDLHNGATFHGAGRSVRVFQH